LSCERQSDGSAERRGWFAVRNVNREHVHSSLGPVWFVTRVMAQA
jgi:hypothetical protein